MQEVGWFRATLLPGHRGAKESAVAIGLVFCHGRECTMSENIRAFMV